MENFPDKISPMTLAAAIALGSGGGGQPTGTVYYPAGSIPFLSLPALTLSRVGAVYDITDDFTSSSDFTDGGGKDYLAGTDVAIVNTGTAENPVLKYNCLTNAINEIVDQAKITISSSGTDLTLSTAAGNINALTVYGKSEVVDDAIKSAGEGWSTVRLADLTWSYNTSRQYFNTNITATAINADNKINGICSTYTADTLDNIYRMTAENKSIGVSAGRSFVKDTDYTTVEDFVASLGDATLCYKLADPTQGNTIAIKTDDGTGIDGTMAIFTTGTPLRGIPDTSVRDVMTWDGSAGTVTKNCGEVDLGTLTWGYNSSSASNPFFYASDINIKLATSQTIKENLVCEAYNTYSFNIVLYDVNIDKAIGVNSVDNAYKLVVKNTDYTDATAFKTAMSGVKLVCELATPTTQSLTTAENASIAGLRTYTPQTHAQNNVQTDMTVEAYAGTENGKAVNELKQDVQSEISALKITQSGTLTLTVAGWSNNAQTITYAHDTSKRNVIDVDLASVEEWANCGILATAETASGITFTCKTVPENALNFKVTSMGV